MLGLLLIGCVSAYKLLDVLEKIDKKERSEQASLEKERYGGE